LYFKTICVAASSVFAGGMAVLHFVAHSIAILVAIELLSAT
jgi:hypothetical protein